MLCSFGFTWGLQCNLLGVLQRVYIGRMWCLVVFMVLVVLVVLGDVLCRVSKEFVRNLRECDAVGLSA